MARRTGGRLGAERNTVAKWEAHHEQPAKAGSAPHARCAYRVSSTTNMQQALNGKS